MSLSIPMSKGVDPLEPGQMILFKGIVQGETFAFNLGAGPNLSREPFDDIGLHLSFRLLEKKIVANSYEGGSWKKEEIHKLDCKPGERIDVRIRALRDRYQIYVNMVPHFQFEHRIPAGVLNHVYMNGNISLSEFSYGKGGFVPVPCDIPVNGLKRGSLVHIIGMAGSKCDQFQINLKAGSDNAFHFNPRFKQNQIVRNSEIGGAWGEEELEGGFTLKKGRLFDIYYNVGDDAYRVEVDGEAFCIFRHRMAPPEVNAITADGVDLELYRVDHN